MFLHIEGNKRDNHSYLKVYTGGGHTKIRKKYNVADDTKYTGGEKKKRN